jgi:hypothetical protein
MIVCIYIYTNDVHILQNIAPSISRNDVYILQNIAPSISRNDVVQAEEHHHD